MSVARHLVFRSHASHTHGCGRLDVCMQGPTHAWRSASLSRACACSRASSLLALLWPVLWRVQQWPTLQPDQTPICPNECSDDVTDLKQGTRCCQNAAVWGVDKFCYLNGPGNTCDCDKSVDENQEKKPCKIGRPNVSLSRHFVCCSLYIHPLLTAITS